jgi:hypothetical protein
LFVEGALFVEISLSDTKTQNRQGCWSQADKQQTKSRQQQQQ